MRHRDLAAAMAPSLAALFGFGFGIVQFFDSLAHAPGVSHPRFPAAPRVMGLSLMAAGILSTIVALWQYRWIVRYLWRPEYASVAGLDRRRWTPLPAIAMLLLLIGTLTFAALVVRA